ncbi:MAG: conjugal transfer protein [Tissierellia bacterium]|nr:conjugal transfer protein [Tissierellia bacterium]
MRNEVLEYSIQLAMLRQLLLEKLIDKREYFKIKEVLMKKYNISSDLTC